MKKLIAIAVLAMAPVVAFPGQNSVATITTNDRGEVVVKAYPPLDGDTRFDSVEEAAVKVSERWSDRHQFVEIDPIDIDEFVIIGYARS